jgi:hypothetical protein
VLAHYQEVTGHVRLYREGSYQARSRYGCIMTVSWCGPEDVYLSGAHGKMDVVSVRDLLKPKGVRRIWYHRGAGSKPAGVGVCLR